MGTLLLVLAISQASLDAAFEKTTNSAQQYVRKIAAGLDPTRSLDIQLALLDEDLVWMQKGFTERQRDIVAVLALYKSLERIAEIIKNPDEEQRILLPRITDFQKRVRARITSMTEALGEIEDSELRIYF